VKKVGRDNLDSSGIIRVAKSIKYELSFEKVFGRNFLLEERSLFKFCFLKIRL
jgi:hypothetical protein